MRLRLSLCLAVVALVSACASPGGSPSPEAPLVLRGATLIDGTGSPPIERATIVVRDGRIEAVAPEGALEVPDDATVIDATGKFVVPGLADMHTHFGRGAPLPKRPDEAEEVLRRQLYYGVTSILQLGASDGAPDTIRRLRERRHP